VSVLTVKVVWLELGDMMAIGTIGEGISVCAVEPHGLYCASIVGWVALMASTYGKVLV
jgi:hypothetical protein